MKHVNVFTKERGHKPQERDLVKVVFNISKASLTGRSHYERNLQFHTAISMTSLNRILLISPSFFLLLALQGITES